MGFLDQYMGIELIYRSQQREHSATMKQQTARVLRVSQTENHP